MMNKLKKDKDLLCGSACLQYIFSEEHHDISIPNMDWIIDMAFFCSLYSSLNIKLIYYKSKLMDDYYSNSLNSMTDIKTRLDYLFKKILIQEEKVTANTLKQFISVNKWIILNVDSVSFFNDNLLVGHRHFVLIRTQNSSLVDVISPGVNEFEEKQINISDLENLIEGNGQWIMVLN